MSDVLAEPSLLTNREKAILDKTVELWNMVVSMPGDHPDDLIELKLDIHRIQDKIMARPTRRAMRVQK